MKKYLSKIVCAGLLAMLFAGCTKVLDKEPTSQLDYKKAYQNVYDADAAVMGIYGKFMGLADRYIILNELRADLLDYTENSDKWLREISNHTVSADNPYASPRPFYEVIFNCNDVLHNLTIMYQDKKINESDYNERYSDIACLRSFLYLQLGIHYGDQVRYVTNPLATLEDAKRPSLFPQVSFDLLLDSLIAFTEPIPFKEEYSVGSSLNMSIDGYPTSKFFINKKVLLGDLYLWKGNYNKAATYYREVMEASTTGTPGETYYSRNKMGWFGNPDNPTDNNVTFSNRARAGDISYLSYDRGWRTMFDASYTADNFTREWIWVLPFDNKFNPVNPLIKLFSPIGGDYLVKPSQEVMDMWSSQTMLSAAIPSAGAPYDPRGLFSVSDVNGQRVAMKFLYKYLNWKTKLPVNFVVKNGDWYLYRQTHLHLRFAEAANQSGWHKLAHALVNDGIPVAFDSTGATNKTQWQNTLDYPAPFNFDARRGDIPSFTGAWYRNMGIRRRAYVTNFPVTGANRADSLVQIENGLIREEALEDAFEGTRWASLLRIARRRNDASFIADKVYQKLLKDGDPNADAARNKLMNKEGWYLPFKL